jgi:hypothetical protein
MKAYWVIGIVMASGLEAFAKDCSVDVYTITRVSKPVGTLAYAAKLKATAMFREIGVNVRMRDGSPPREAIGACGVPIVVQIEDADRHPVPQDALAYALPYNTSGTRIYVFLDRVARRGNNQPGFMIALLAHVMVHEIGHVLQQIVRHSEDGLMKANWSNQDYQRMERAPLPFAPEDVEFIREGLAKRFPRATAE